ncbi:MAG: amidohydrolase family protein [Candidatus Aenigmarchaeota archaeon]|nr:amidohydrolase family protein [Candidatus Aenigmarchaeota archaeon]
MRVIDCHTHPEFEDEKLKKTAKENKINFSYKGLLEEMRKNNVKRIVGISSNIKSNELIANLMQRDKRILAIRFVSTSNISKKTLIGLNKELDWGKFKGIKLPPGYEYFYPNETKCNQIYRIAEKYNAPVIFHSGDTWRAIEKTKIKYAHPVYVDDVAVGHPDLKIIVAHSGNPWVVDAAEIAYKNENVFLDISG